MDRVTLCRQETRPMRWDDIRSVLEKAGKRYRRVRIELELLSGEESVIVRHIKSYPDWEYFVENFTESPTVCAFNQFNSVIVYKNEDTELVLMCFMPNYNRNDKNNIEFGRCTFDDILNIEEIIEKRKSYYTKKDSSEK